MFLLWSPDNSNYRTDSSCSRFLLCVLPASLYAFEGAVNVTLQVVTAQITASFNKLSDNGLCVRDLPSLGGGSVS